MFSGDIHIIPVLLDAPAMEDGLLSQFSDLLLSGCLDLGVPSIDKDNFHDFHDDNMSFEPFAK